MEVVVVFVSFSSISLNCAWIYLISFEVKKQNIYIDKYREQKVISLYLYLYLIFTHLAISVSNLSIYQQYLHFVWKYLFLSKCHLWSITCRLHTRLLLVLLTPTLLINLTCKENCQPNTFSLDSLQKQASNTRKSCFSFPALHRAYISTSQRLSRVMSWEKNLTLTYLSFGCKRFLFSPLIFQACWAGITQAV